MMPMRVRRKRFGMEKVENLYRTARAQNDSTNTPKQIRSRLRDSRRRRAATNRAGWPIRNRGSLVAEVLFRFGARANTIATRSSSPPGRPAGSFPIMPGPARAPRAGRASAARPVRGAAGLRHISEQSVQMRSVDQAAGETASHCQK